ncbi:hypothetical protein GCM10009007_19640 [Formosimonas limnophila]|uniref:Methyltransferase domain-containing protein n=1 Tax=Formosimonas limnophila TaxID=1384487 RepID=A0A8J3CPF3_9BURK|nr:class I SAM-dependent methyltransferase [Formosimonas limnophila]GHA78601.1 hypothetical protein GCM10009007_19640 [Formosimonas limnophila]
MAYTPIWHSLNETGTHSAPVYSEHERFEIRGHFAFPPQHLLDIGCAQGSVSAALKRDYPELSVWGIELNTEAADIAQQRLDVVSRLPLTEQTPNELTELANIDTVLLLDVLEHMYQPWQTLQFLSHHLAKHAQVIVILPCVMHINLLHDLSHGDWQYQQWGSLDVTHLRFFTPYEMRKMFYETGFKVESVSHQVLQTEANQSFSADSVYPQWLEFEHMKLKVRDFEHWYDLHAVGLIFRIRIADDNELSADEYALRHSPHRPTLAFGG